MPFVYPFKINKASVFAICMHQSVKTYQYILVHVQFITAVAYRNRAEVVNCRPKSTMKMTFKNLLAGGIIFCASLLHAQQKEIQVIEKVNLNKVSFFALNETETDYDVLFSVSGTNIRQSKAKPRWIRIPAASKVHLKNIYLFRDKKPAYSYDLQVNDSLSKRALKKPHVKITLPPKRKIPEKNLVIYVPAPCTSCEVLIAALEKDFYAYRVVTLANNDDIVNQLSKAFPNTSIPLTEREYPIISIEGRLYTSVNSYEQLKEVLHSN